MQLSNCVGSPSTSSTDVSQRNFDACIPPLNWICATTCTYFQWCPWYSSCCKGLITLLVQFIDCTLKNYVSWNIKNMPRLIFQSINTVTRQNFDAAPKQFGSIWPFQPLAWPFSWHAPEWWVWVVNRVTWQNFDTCTGTILLYLFVKIKLLAFPHLNWKWIGDKNSPESGINWGTWQGGRVQLP